MSDYRSRARLLIAELTRDLPEAATIAERRKALWGRGWRMHQGTWYGRKIWGQEVRKYLGRNGDTSSAAPSPLWPDHVCFPFRKQDDGK